MFQEQNMTGQNTEQLTDEELELVDGGFVLHCHILAHDAIVAQKPLQERVSGGVRAGGGVETRSVFVAAGDVN